MICIRTDCSSIYDRKMHHVTYHMSCSDESITRVFTGVE